MPDGEWRSRYVQAGVGATFLSLPDPDKCNSELEKYASEIYVKISSLADTLLGVSYPTEPPAFKRRGPSLKVKQFGYNHLKQQLQVRDYPPYTKELPKLRTFRENKDFLAKYVPSLIIGDNRPERGMTGAGAPRTACDTCLWVAKASAQKGGCPSVDSKRDDPECGDNESCVTDEKLRRPCFFSKTNDIGGKQGIPKADRVIRPDLQMLLRVPERKDYWVIQRPFHLPTGNMFSPTAEDEENGQDDEE